MKILIKQIIDNNVIYLQKENYSTFLFNSKEKTMTPSPGNRKTNYKKNLKGEINFLS